VPSGELVAGMPEQLRLPGHLATNRWKVKIRDVEGPEPPHATVIRGTTAWRWDLRERRFMDRIPDPREVPAEVVELLQANHESLARWWDAAFPWNPVGEGEDEG
jgi:hypothetical protein